MAVSRPRRKERANTGFVIMGRHSSIHFTHFKIHFLLPMINTRNILEFLAEPFHMLLKNPQKFRCEIKKNPTIQMKLSIPDQVADSNEIVHWDTWENRGLNHKFSLRWWNKSQSY